MRNIFATTALAGVICLAVPMASALAESKQDFVLVNHTGYQIEKVYVSPSRSNDWQDDVLGRNVLSDTEHVKIKFHRHTSTCRWDIKVVCSNAHGAGAVWNDVDICTVSKITVHYNPKTHATTATSE